MKELPLYPIKFHPVFKEKIWGGSKLKSQLNKQDAPENCGESWEISAVPGSVSVVKNGFLEGNTLQDILEIYMGDLLGPDIFELYGEIFPLLIKFIDANDDLSVQVHPDDEVAAKKHQSFGKTEAWYILDAEKDAKLISGFNKPLGKSEFVARMNNNDILPVLNRVPAKAEDLFFIPAGRVHATGKGILFAEIQQNSDVTYRIYDWDRMGVDGKPRQLHVQEALEVIDFSEVKQAETPYESEINSPSRMLRTDYFIMNMIHIDDKITKSYVDCQSFVVYMCVDGKAEIRSDNTSETIEKGETILLPYELLEIQIIPNKEVKLIEVYIELE
ncbi:MAG: mannose-6-phosphate isomerase [Bacteroidales bacterium]|jgi:mannose-6-phosphate isomerase|nr:mannose-6-phosphate isomerase [Bacteroidales bacterium]